MRKITLRRGDFLYSDPLEDFNEIRIKQGAFMALSYSGIEPVEFGGKECTPKITTELKMRLSQIKAYNEKDDEVLASAFPDDEAYVCDFLKNRMTILEKQTLQAYLLGGMMAVNTIMDGIKDNISRRVGNE